MSQPQRRPPAYAIASVDHALRLAAMLQLEGGLTVSEAADRLGVARSTAHRVLTMLVYRDFAVRDDDRVYRAGPVLELAAHSRSEVSVIRQAALPLLRRLVDLVDESANVAIRVGRTVRFVASVESAQSLRVGSREGMVFPAHETTAGLLLLADLEENELVELYAAVPEHERAAPADLADLRRELLRVRRAGFALNQDLSERGVTAIGVPVLGRAGDALAGLSISMPSARFEPAGLPSLLGLLRRAAETLRMALDPPAQQV